jgi:3-oxoacyl-[acyl-carrier protein] reductase
VINLSTISSTNPSPNSLFYSASKSAIDTITRELALELAGKGIRVNAIAPGMTETEGFAAAGLSAESAKALGFSLPMGRLGKPEDIARVALFLASDQSAWVTGERISASGGQGRRGAGALPVVARRCRRPTRSSTASMSS